MTKEEQRTESKALLELLASDSSKEEHVLRRLKVMAAERTTLKWQDDRDSALIRELVERCK